MTTLFFTCLILVGVLSAQNILQRPTPTPAPTPASQQVWDPQYNHTTDMPYWHDASSGRKVIRDPFIEDYNPLPWVTQTEHESSSTNTPHRSSHPSIANTPHRSSHPSIAAHIKSMVTNKHAMDNINKNEQNLHLVSELVTAILINDNEYSSSEADKKTATWIDTYFSGKSALPEPKPEPKPDPDPDPKPDPKRKPEPDDPKTAPPFTPATDDEITEWADWWAVPFSGYITSLENEVTNRIKAYESSRLNSALPKSWEKYNNFYHDRSGGDKAKFLKEILISDTHRQKLASAYETKLQLKGGGRRGAAPEWSTRRVGLEPGVLELYDHFYGPNRAGTVRVSPGAALQTGLFATVIILLLTTCMILVQVLFGPAAGPVDGGIVAKYRGGGQVGGEAYPQDGSSQTNDVCGHDLNKVMLMINMMKDTHAMDNILKNTRNLHWVLELVKTNLIEKNQTSFGKAYRLTEDWYKRNDGTCLQWGKLFR